MANRDNKDELPNGFTGFSQREAGFVSAGEAMRKAEKAPQTIKHSRPDLEQEGWRANTVRPSEAERGDSWDYGTRAMMRYLQPIDPDDKGAVPAFDEEKLKSINEDNKRWAWIEVDLSAIRHNLGEIKKRLARGARIMAVVKADGYGHGAVQCARTALNSGAEYIGVATVDEAVELREALINAPILVLNEPPASSIPLLLAYKIMPSVYTAEFAMQYAESADMLGSTAPFHLKVNTGMNRIGIRYDEVVSFMHQIGFHRAIDLVGTFTHFATADSPEVLDFNIQQKRFTEAIEALRAAGIDPGTVHAANSAAAIRYPEAHFDMVRVGIALYGLHPSEQTYPLIDLIPAMSVRARITDTKLVPMSEGVSYGLRYRSPGSVKICTVPLGYADGLRRELSGNTNFIVDGKEFPQVGAICMDQCMFEVDLRSYGTKRRVDPQIGDDVIIVGSEGDAVVTLDDMAKKLNTINYELAVGFGTSRLSRIYT